MSLCQYFAFLHEYATWLLLPAVLGVAVQEPTRRVTLSELFGRFLSFMSSVQAVLSLDHDGLDAVRGSCQV